MYSLRIIKLTRSVTGCVVGSSRAGLAGMVLTLRRGEVLLRETDTGQTDKQTDGQTVWLTEADPF